MYERPDSHRSYWIRAGILLIPDTSKTGHPLSCFLTTRWKARNQGACSGTLMHGRHSPVSSCAMNGSDGFTNPHSVPKSSGQTALNGQPHKDGHLKNIPGGHGIFSLRKRRWSGFVKNFFGESRPSSSAAANRQNIEKALTTACGLKNRRVQPKIVSLEDFILRGDYGYLKSN